MARRYRSGIVTPAAAAGAAYADLVADANTPIYVREIGLWLNAATASYFGLERSTAVGTRTSPIAGVPDDPNAPTGTGTTAVAWSVAPTPSGNYMRRTIVDATIGHGFVWTFDPFELIIPPTKGLLIWNPGAGAGSVCHGYIEWDEGGM